MQANSPADEPQLNTADLLLIAKWSPERVAMFSEILRRCGVNELEQASCGNYRNWQVEDLVEAVAAARRAVGDGGVAPLAASVPQYLDLVPTGAPDLPARFVELCSSGAYADALRILAPGSAITRSRSDWVACDNSGEFALGIRLREAYPLLLEIDVGRLRDRTQRMLGIEVALTRDSSRSVVECVSLLINAVHTVGGFRLLCRSFTASSWFPGLTYFDAVGARIIQRESAWAYASTFAWGEQVGDMTVSMINGAYIDLSTWAVEARGVAIDESKVMLAERISIGVARAAELWLTEISKYE